MSPSLQAIWLMDAVDWDETTGKLTLSGCFDRIDIPEGAEYTEGAVVFFSVRNVRGQARLKLMCVDLRTDEVLVDRDVIATGSPLETTDIAVRINRIPVPHPGVYAWEVYHGRTLLGTMRYEATVGGMP